MVCPAGIELRGEYSNNFLVGKQWHEPKTAFRPKAGNSTYEKRQAERVAMAAMKAKEKEMKDEKEAARQVGFLAAEFADGYVCERG